MRLVETVGILKAGGIGVLPTDTIYGLVGCALDRKAVERIYVAKKRAPAKPCIVLISEIADLQKFGVAPDAATSAVLRKLWPAPVSIILPCDRADFEYLHRGTKTLAFRLPADVGLRELLVGTGPLIAPSANPEGLSPAKTINEARDYFNGNVDFYEQGTTHEAPSTLVSIVGGKVSVLREGSVSIPKEFL